MENKPVTTDDVHKLSLLFNNTNIENNANNSATGFNGEQNNILEEHNGARSKAVTNKNEYPMLSKTHPNDYERADHAKQKLQVQDSIPETDGPKDSSDNWNPMDHVNATNPSHQPCPTSQYCDPTAQAIIVPSCSLYPEINNEPSNKDFVILNDSEDEEEALKLRDHLRYDFPDVQPAITVELLSSEGIGETVMECLHCLRYKFKRILVLVTDHLCNNRKTKFFTTVLQTIDLESTDNKRDQIVPVWTCATLTGTIWQLKPLKGLDYWKDFGPEPLKALYHQQVANLVKHCRKSDG